MKTPSLPGISPLTPIADVAGHHAFTGTADDREVIVLVAADTGTPRNPKTLARLAKHPHIAGVVTSGTLDGRRFTVLQAPRGTLQDSLGRVSGGEATRWIVQAADAMAAAHAADVIHGAIDPTTIGLDAARRACVLGFPLLADARRQPRSPYAPPEAAAGYGHPSEAGDVFSLAAVLYEFLTGHPPDPALAHWELCRTLDDPGVPPPIAAVIRAGLATDPVHRPSAEMFHTQLAAALGELERVHEAALRQDPAPSEEAETEPSEPEPDAFELLGTLLSGIEEQGTEPHGSTPAARADRAPVSTTMPVSASWLPDPAAMSAAASAAPVPTAAVPSQTRPAIRPAPVSRQPAERESAALATHRAAPEWLAPALWVAALICALFAAQIAFATRLFG